MLLVRQSEGKNRDKNMTLVQENKEIDKIFRQIELTCSEYLEFIYPEAPDPDVYIDEIEVLVNKYKELIKTDKLSDE